MSLIQHRIIDCDGIELTALSLTHIHYLKSIGRIVDSSLVFEETTGRWVPLAVFLQALEPPRETTPEPVVIESEPVLLARSKDSTQELVITPDMITPPPVPAPPPEPIFAHIPTADSPLQPPPPVGSFSDSQKAPAPPQPLTPGRRIWFIAHWRGDLSLGVSYWGMGALVYVAYFLVAFGIAAIATPIGGSYAISIYWITFWLSASLIQIWLMVGIWRSADRHVGRGGSHGWATTAKVMVVIGALSAIGSFLDDRNGLKTIQESLAQVRRVSGYKYEVRPLRNGTELEIRGDFGVGIADAFDKALAANPGVRVIQIDSSGGLIAEAKRVRESIRSRGLTTYVSRECTSAATLAFLGGVERFVSDKAKLGFHQPTFPTMGDEAVRKGLADEETYIVSVGVNREFVRKAFTFQGTNVWYPTQVELVSAGVVTGITTGDQFGMTAIDSWKDKTKLEQDLLKTPLFQALKDFEPTIYSKILAAFYESAHKGNSQNDLRAITIPLIQKAAMQRLPRTSDNAVIAFVSVLVTEMDVLVEVSPEYCYDYLYPSAGQYTNYSRYFSAELSNAELDATKNVITTFDATIAVPNESQVMPDITKALRFIISKYGNDAVTVIENIDKPEVRSKMDKKLVCSVISDMYRSILKLPPKKAARTLRYLFANT